MPDKYHIETKAVLPRKPRVGKYGVVDWREDCSRCHNCVKKACIYDRYREEQEYIKGMKDVDSLYFDCMGCFSCVQECTKGLLNLSQNPSYNRLGDNYWNPDIIRITWQQAENAKVPVSGAGYGGKFTGHGFDSMWTDMSEIVRPTRDGIHGREYISTSVDIGRKLPHLSFDGNEMVSEPTELIDLPLPMIIDMMPANYSYATIEPFLKETALRTKTIALVDSRKWNTLGEVDDKYLPHLAFYLADGESIPAKEMFTKTRLVEIADCADVKTCIAEIKKVHPSVIIAIRVELDAKGVNRAIELSEIEEVEVIHVVADMNGDQLGVDDPKFVKDMTREIHDAMIDKGVRDEVTLIAGGGIALAEHLAKEIICGADLVSFNMPLLIALECQLCGTCTPEMPCPAKLKEIDSDYAVGRMVNLVAAWHNQLIEVMGAMGMREARRLRGDVGRAMFFEEIEEESFGKLFGTRKKA